MRLTSLLHTRSGKLLLAGLALAGAAALAACTSVTAVQPDGTFTLQVGDRARVHNGDFTIHFVSVPADSRCPVDVVCVWAGDAVVRLDVTSSGWTRQHDLHTNSSVGDVSIEHDNHVVELIDLTPAARSGQPIAQGDYTARLRVSSW